MDMWKMEQFEIGQREYDEMMEYLAYEADMAEMEDDLPTDAEMEAMYEASMSWQDWVLEF